jgi:flagellar biosynthetic protein FliO
MTGVEQIGPVLLVLALLFFIMWWLKRRGMATFAGIRFRKAGDVQRQLETLERMPLTTQHSLHLVRVRDRMLLIGVAPSGCSLISDCGSTPDKQYGTTR